MQPSGAGARRLAELRGGLTLAVAPKPHPENRRESAGSKTAFQRSVGMQNGQDELARLVAQLRRAVIRNELHRGPAPERRARRKRPPADD